MKDLGSVTSIHVGVSTKAADIDARVVELFDSPGKRKVN